MAEADAATLERPRFGGIPDFYAAIWSEARAAAARWRLAIIIEVVFVAAWLIIRSTVAVDDRAYVAWIVAAGVLALVAPLSGLVVLVSSSVFYEPDPAPLIIPIRVLVLVPLAVGVLIRIVADRLRWRPEPAILLALLLVAGTALGVVNTFERLPNDFAGGAMWSWFNNMAGPVILLIAAAWTARGGSMRVLVAACIVAVVSATVAITEHLSPGLISGSQFEWVGFWKDFGARLGGTVPSPNALSAQLIVPTMVLLAAVVLAGDIRIKLIAVVGLVPLLLGNYLTYSRAPLIGLYVFGVVVAWRFRRWLGVAILVAGLAIGIALLPSYLQLRAENSGVPTIPGTILVASDEYRFQAWRSAVAMWQDEPLIGQGYLAYKALGDSFGDTILGSPHNEWLRLFAEEGTVVGLVGIGFVIATAWSLARIPRWLGAGLLAGFLAYVVAATFNNPFLFIRVSAVAFSIVGVGLAFAERTRLAPVSPTTNEQPEQAPEEAGSPDELANPPEALDGDGATTEPGEDGAPEPAEEAAPEPTEDAAPEPAEDGAPEPAEGATAELAEPSSDDPP